MADREDNVYMAKLAEQAERYDGKAFGRERPCRKESLGILLFFW
jgi:hypothetical protein